MSIQLNNISKTYQNSIQVLSDVSLHIGNKDRIAITGPSGSGKSTLLRIMAGLESPTSGDVLINDKPIYELPDDHRSQLRAHTFGFIFQSFRLFDALTVIDNIALSLHIKGEKDAKNIANEWLKKVGLQNRDQHFPNELSGGEMQRVAIARALATNPDIIIADEPTGNLDEKTSDVIQTLLLDCLKNAGLILVTHDLKLATICDTHYRLAQGTLQS